MNIIKEYISSFLISESRGIVIDENYVKKTINFIINFLIKNYNNIGEKKENEIYGYQFKTSYTINNEKINYILTLEFLDKHVTRYQNKKTKKNPFAVYAHNIREGELKEIRILFETKESIYDKSQEEFEEIIKIFILENFNDAYFIQHLEASLAHELTHLVDYYYYDNDIEKDNNLNSLEEYYNNKAELKALITEIYQEVSDNIYNSYVTLSDDIIYPEVPKEDVLEYIKYTEGFLKASPYLSKKSKEKIFKQVYTRLVDRGFLDLSVTIRTIQSELKTLLIKYSINKNSKITEDELSKFLSDNKNYTLKDRYAKNLIFTSMFEYLENRGLIEID